VCARVALSCTPLTTSGKSFGSVVCRTLALVALYRGASLMLQVNVATDSPCAWCMTSPLGTPRGKYDECSG
jgi:hypothetical protein